MKRSNIPNASADVPDSWTKLAATNIVVQLADGSELILIAIDDFDREIVRSRNNPRLMEVLDARAAQPATVSLDEAKRRLDL